MAKAGWNDLMARFPEPHLLVAQLPTSDEKDMLSNAQAAQRLLVRLIRKLPTKGEFAVTVSRLSGKREVLCAFADSSDARLVAKAAEAAKAPTSSRERYSFILDHSAERKITEIAGHPAPHRKPSPDPL